MHQKIISNTWSKNWWCWKKEQIQSCSMNSRSCLSATDRHISEILITNSISSMVIEILIVFNSSYRHTKITTDASKKFVHLQESILSIIQKITYCIISVIKYFWNGEQINGTRIRVMGGEGERKDAAVIIKVNRRDTYDDGTVQIVDCVNRYKILHV